jgi:aminoglycoside phosphotransferase (APT) family kinase protein
MITTPNLAADSGIGAPAADVEMSETILRALLAEQHPDLADATISFVSSGWDNWVYRVGDELCTRLPRRAVAVDLLQNEQRWLSWLAPGLPLPIPAPVRFGQPSAIYPYPWSLVPWIEGQTVSLGFVRDDQSGPLVAFLKALHQPAPADAPTSDCRGLPLGIVSHMVKARLARLASVVPQTVDALGPVWLAACRADPSFEPVMLHGDPHPRNVLVDPDGRLAAFIDWGDMCSGDPASDLAAIWFLLPSEEARAHAILLYGADSHLVARAMGWAMHIGTILLEAGLGGAEEYGRLGNTILDRVLHDFRLPRRKTDGVR